MGRRVEQARAGGEDGDAERLVEWVDRFVRESEERPGLDLDQFVARAPEHLRRELRALCADVSFVRDAMPSRPPEPPALGLGPGTVLGDFALGEELGRGAMGIVYRAEQLSLSREVAVKVLFPHWGQVPRRVERFRREAQAAAKLRHSGIVPVFAIGEHAGLYYFAMELVEGGTLAVALERARSAGERPSVLGLRHQPGYIARVAAIAAGIADALEAAHSASVIHRDVKPQNILLDRQLAPRLADFGLAKDLELDSLSGSGDIAGTAYYMSPEQALARRVHIDHRTDVFSLGVVLYEMLTLVRPFEGSTSQQVLYRLSFDDPAPISRLNPAVPRDLQTICAKAMEKRPENRYATAGALAADLRRFLAHEAIEARPPSRGERLIRKARKHRTAVVGCVAGALALVIGVVAQRTVHASRESDARWEELAAIDLDSARATGDVVRLRRALELAEAELATSPPAPRRERAQAVRDAVRDWTSEERARARGLFAAAGLGANDGDLVQPLNLRFWSSVQGLEHAQRAAAVSGAGLDADLAELTSVVSLYPRLTVRTREPGARVGVRRIDFPSGRIGELRALGLTPLENVPLEPGTYRVVVEDGAGRFAELRRNLFEPRTAIELDAVLASPTALAADMQRIAAGPFVYGVGTKPHFAERTERMDEPFLIDRTEVSNRAYREFVIATGHAAPLHWPEPYDDALDPLPVVAVSLSDAQSYAEWRGARLPTELEWERAARGTDGRLYPWRARERGDARPSEDEVRAIGRLLAQPARTLDDYLRGVVAVDALPESASPDGVLHMLGNVAEWTEGTSTRERRDGVLLIQPELPIVRGHSYKNDPTTKDVAWISETNADNRMFDVGFRCAKSVVP